MEVQFERRPGRGLDAAFGGQPAQHQRVDALGVQRFGQAGMREDAVARLAHHQLIGAGQRIDKIRSACAVAPDRTIRRDDAAENQEDTGSAGGFDQRLRLRHRRRDRGHVGAGFRHGAIGRREVALDVDHQQRRARRRYPFGRHANAVRSRGRISAPAMARPKG